MIYDPMPVVSNHAYVHYYDTNGPPTFWSVLGVFVLAIGVLLFLGWLFTR